MEELPFRNWCLSCLHTSIAEYDPEEKKAFQINCAASEDGTDSSCERCHDRNITCEQASLSFPLPLMHMDHFNSDKLNQPAIGMLGDVYDLCAILEWAGKFWSRHADLYWKMAFRLAICEATKALCLKFEDAERSHRRSHMLSGIDWDDTSREQNADINRYRRFLAKRRRALRASTPPTTGIINRQDWITYNPERLLRLCRGDSGFVEWSKGKTEFLDFVQRKSISIYGGDESNSGRQRLAVIKDTFPAHLM
ncbi:hypothetical protein PITC_024320 [Penicillium italicum]|uniref:Uncharacterized protein n=1 Tax=Penicillium italicum TaxID=40296 RepID=A0A0A2LLE5_PENIT|nr:hypothetical protein PITC_024320 [Penicillium italicum]